MVFLVAFIYVTFLLANSHPVRAASGTISTDQSLYPIWGIGGTVKVTAQNLVTNVTYYLWLQKPKQVLSYLVGPPFTAVNGSIQSPIFLPISPIDPPGTYSLSLSRSGATNTREAVAHFGILGSDSLTYERTKIVTIAGGGFAANSSITLTVRLGNTSIASFPVIIATRANGEFTYSFKLSPSSATGALNVTAIGLTFDNHQSGKASSFIIVRPTTISVKVLSPPGSQVERTAETSASYRISYPDGSPVTKVNATADIVSGGQTISSVPLALVNSTTGEWRGAWAPSQSANTTSLYHFQLDPATLTDAYGNSGQGSRVASADFEVVPAKLELTIQTNHTLQRTQPSITTISATYHNGANVANVTQATVVIIGSDGKKTSLVALVNGTLVPAQLQIPANASLGTWTLSYSVEDVWGNSGSGNSKFLVQIASPTFQLQTPPTTERTTLLNVTDTMYYPGGTRMNSTTTLMISHGNQTWMPKLNFNSTTLVWSSSLYIVQNATLGPYNVTWSTHDSYGNGGSNNSTSIVVPARFRFGVRPNNSTVEAFTNLDLNVTVKYPNGTSLTNNFGNATAYYLNATGFLLTQPLVYNETDNSWNLLFSTPEQGNFTFSFSAVDRYGNAGVAEKAYNLKIIPSPRVQTQRLIIAGIIGVLIPVALLIWAIATISTRRRKHKP